MGDSLALFLGTAELLCFFVFDFILARTLNTFKQDHPELEECAPEDVPDVDPVAVMGSLRQTVVEMYDNQQRWPGGNAEGGPVNDAINPEVVTPPQPFPCSRKNVLHSAVVVCGLVAPIVTVLQVLLPGLFGWCRFDVPAWLQYVGVIPGLAAVLVVATRTLRVASLSEISRQQWMLLMWFRLDFMCITSAVAFLGAGSWLVAACMLIVALYLAHRVMRIENRLKYLTHETQLVRGEVDLQHVYPPGSEQARQALASSDVQGYSALR